MGGGYYGGFKNTKGSLKPEDLMEELRNSGVKFTEEDIVMVTKTKKNELVWLEKGTNLAGLKHIMDRHANDLKNKFGISKENIPNFIKEVFSNGKETSCKFKNGGFEKEYLYKNEHIVISGVGTNGFIISIYPKKGGK